MDFIHLKNSMTSKWYFRKFRPADTASDPDFAKALFPASSSSSLVRESIQNSLDARIENQRAMVRFTLRTGARALRPADAAGFLDGFWEHVHSSKSGLKNAPTPSERIPFLVIEDFGTKGLIGSPDEWEPFASEKNFFYLFFRALGRSGKKNEERGRWGVGKFVFSLASRAHCLFGYTIPADSGRSLLMGRMVLKVHQANGDSFHPDGHWGNRQDNELVLPEPEADVVNKFKTLFGISRTKETGLSVVVPWLAITIDGDAITRAVIAEYFLPILRSELAVEIDDNGSIKRIDAESIASLSNAIESPELKARIRLALEAATWPLGDIDLFREIPLYGTPDWRGISSPEQKTELLRKLDDGNPIAIRIPIEVRTKTGTGQKSFFDVFIQRCDNCGSLRPLIVREGITISEDKTQAIHDHVALVVIDDGPLAGFVGDAETPAHTTLQHDLVSDEYSLAAKLIALLRRSTAEIVKSLEENTDTDDFALLSEFFPVSQDEERGRRQTGRKSGGATDIPPVPPIPAVPARYRVTQTTGGFRIKGTEQGELPPFLTIRCAYFVRRGSPFKKYSPLDFSFSGPDLCFETNKSTILERTENRIVLRPDGPEFSLDVSGFDSLRELVVNVEAAPSDNQ